MIFLNENGLQSIFIRLGISLLGPMLVAVPWISEGIPVKAFAARAIGHAERLSNTQRIEMRMTRN